MAERRISLLARRIKVLREARGWSQRELARQADVHHNTIATLERGDRQELSTRDVLHIARVLETSIDYLVGRFEETEESEIMAVVL